MIILGKIIFFTENQEFSSLNQYHVQMQLQIKCQFTSRFDQLISSRNYISIFNNSGHLERLID